MKPNDAIAALEKSNPGLGAYLAGREAKGILRCTVSATGAPTGSSGGFWLHSRFDPRSEARKLADSIGRDNDAIVLVGAGLGYALEACAERRRDIALIVAEVDAGFFLDCLAVEGVASRVSSTGAVIVPDADGPSVVEALRMVGARSPSLSVNPAYRALFPEACASIESGVAAYLDEKRMNERTLRRFGMLWTRNIIRNALWMDTSRGVADASGIMRGMPALVVAAGPSLDRLLPSIRELAKRFVVVCVDTATRALAHWGVAPDFIVVADPQYWNARHLDGIDCSRSVLVAECAVHPDVFKHEYRGVLLFSSRYPLGRRLEAARMSALGALGAGGSVATSAWDFARLLSPASVALAGLDLSYPGHRSHTRGSYFEERAREAATRLKPHEHGAWASIHVAGATYRPSADGGLVLSDRRLGLYASWFEARAGRPGLLRVGAGGLALEGFDDVDTDTLLSFPVVEAKKAEALASLPPSNPRTGSSVMEALSGIARELAALRDLGLAGIEAAGSRDFVRLESIDRDILSIDARVVLSFVLPNMDASVGAASDLEGCAEEAMAMYRGLVEAAQRIKDWIDRSLMVVVH
jgi:hypothetical protein